MTTVVERVQFFRPGLRLEIGESQGRCWLTFVVERAVDPSVVEVRFQISYQPRDRRGLPTGPPRVVYEDVWPLAPTDRGPHPSVEGWLPEGLPLSFIRECHVRA